MKRRLAIMFSLVIGLILANAATASAGILDVPRWN
jgi:hypothetical protein